MSEPATREPATQDGAATPRRRNWFLTLLPLVIFLALAGIFLRQLAAGGGSNDIPSALIGKPVPQFELAPLDGLKDAAGEQVAGLSSDGFRNAGGKFTVVNVWASWCGPCRFEHPLLMQLAERQDIALVGINYKDETANALRFLGQLGNPFSAVGIDPKGRTAIDWGVYGVPETFVVSPDGKIAYKHVGPLTEENFETKFLPELEGLLKGAGG